VDEDLRRALDEAFDSSGIGVIPALMIMEAGSEFMSCEEFGELIEGHQGDLAERFDAPDDDWSQFMAIQCVDGSVHVFYIDVLMDPRIKDFLATWIVPRVIRETNARTFGFAFNAWAIDMKQHSERPNTMPSDHPDRFEVLEVIVADWSGHMYTASAKINRTNTAPPILSDWDARPFDGMKGRFVDPMLAAMKEQAKVARAEQN
jgi:hypothetical protein